MVDLISSESRQATEPAVTVVLLLFAEDSVAVLIAICEENAIAVGVSVY